MENQKSAAKLARDVLGDVAQYLAARSEMYAALHCSTDVQFPPLMKRVQAAKTIMDDIYAGFWNESDGGWQARIMRLLDARAVAIDAAGEYENNHARDLAVALNDQQNVWDRYLDWGWLRLSDVAQEMGIDIGDMNPGSATADDWRSCGPALVDELQQTIREQDRKLRQVKDLSGGASW